MLPEPGPADPGWDEDLTWLDRDPERETWLDRAREHEEPPEPEEYEDYAPLTEEELAGIREAAADELLAVEAATSGRRGPGQPGSARVFPGESSSPATAFGPGMIGHLDSHLPGTKAALRDGTVSLGKVRIIAAATVLLDEGEAAAAEAEVLDRAARLTPGGLRAVIARAVIKAAPKKAKQRREALARFARVERWLEDSGNAALAGRELPPDEVLAADERITAWAGELKAAGLDGGMDELRARAYLDLLLGKDSRPGQDQLGAPGQPGAVAPEPGGFAGRVTLTVPLATLTDFADRPGELAGLGPVDPWLARDLAGAAAQNPKSTWCVTVTDEKGHAVGHGCARPEPKSHTKRAGPGPPGFTFTPASRARSRGQAKAPVPDPAHHLHQPDLPSARRPVRP